MQILWCINYTCAISAVRIIFQRYDIFRYAAHELFIPIRYNSGACTVYAVRLLFHPYKKLAYRTTQRPAKISLKMEITHQGKMAVSIVDAKANNGKNAADIKKESTIYKLLVSECAPTKMRSKIKKKHFRWQTTPPVSGAVGYRI